MKNLERVLIGAMWLFLMGCAKNLSGPIASQSNLTLGDISFVSPLQDYATTQDAVIKGNHLLRAAGAPLASATPTGQASPWKQVIGPVKLQFISSTPGVSVLTDTVQPSALAAYQKTIHNGTYNIELSAISSTASADTFIRFSAIDTNVVVNGNKTLVFRAIPSDGLITVPATALQTGTKPSFTVDLGNGPVSPIFGERNGYYYLYVKGQTQGELTITIPGGQNVTKALSVSANFHYNLIPGKESNAGPITILFTRFTLNNITINSSNVLVSTFAGTGQPGSKDGPGSSATFFVPTKAVVDELGNIFVTDFNRIRKIDAAGNVSTFAGSGQAGSTDGSAKSASFRVLDGIVIDGFGNLFVADGQDNKIRKIDPSGNVSTFAGTGQVGATDGTGDIATFDSPAGLAIDGRGNLYVADFYNHKIRKISPSGVVSTYAGNGLYGTTDGPANSATLALPHSIAIDAAGNLYEHDYIFFDSSPNSPVRSSDIIRKIDPFGYVSKFVGTGQPGFADGPGDIATFMGVQGLTVDPSGNIYVADPFNYRIRKIDPTGNVSTFAGSGQIGAIDGPGNMASFNVPNGVTADKHGNLYVVDHYKIRKITISY